MISLMIVILSVRFVACSIVLICLFVDFSIALLVKIVLFRAYCICLYDSSLWKHYNAGSIVKLTSCYNKCLKTFFGFKRRDSLTGILLQLGLPTFNTILCNGHAIFQRCYSSCKNGVVEHLFSLGY